jgi:hypothetical protein
MKRLVLPLLIGCLALSGCASQYVIKLTNGNEITTASKPKLKGTAYSFKDAKGQEHLVSQGRVYEIAPASMSKAESKPKPPQPNHKRKWYFLWLA